MNYLPLLSKLKNALPTVLKSPFYAPDQVGAAVNDSSEDATTQVYDFIIIGGGTAAMVLANRLSADQMNTVLVLEAGKSGLPVWRATTPVTFSLLQRTPHDWANRTVPQPALNNREMPWTRTKLLGGCSTGNALMFHHGAPEDYDRWAQLQGTDPEAQGWSYKAMKKYLMRFETFVPHPDVPIDTEERGKDGPMQIGHFAFFPTVGRAFLETCENVGIHCVDDVNTSKGTLGATRTPTYIDSRGRRVSTESAYLTPDVLARPNLKVAVGAHVTRITFDRSGSQPRATGVQFAQTRGGPIYVARARTEVILSAGAVNTPQILLLSGIGDAKHLAEHGIDVVKALPGVGQHLMDHLAVNIGYATKPGRQDLSYRTLLTGNGILAAIRIGPALLEYKLFGTGIFTMNSQESFAFVRIGDGPLCTNVLKRPDMATIGADSTTGKGAPDMEIMASSLAWRDHGHQDFDVGDAMSITPAFLRPTSLGEVRLTSADPWAAPVIDPRYMTTPRDMETMVRGIRLADAIAHTEPMASLLDLDDASRPLLDHHLGELSDSQLVELIKERAETLYHPTSTARMAPLEDGGVVDTSLRVYGVDGLRIVDASVMPEIVSGHTSASTIAIAEKAADLILQSGKLA